MTNVVTQATTTVYGVLEPFSSEERKRIVRAALMLLGDETEVSPRSSGHPSSTPFPEAERTQEDDLSVIHEGARPWVRKAGLSIASLEHVFHFDQGRVKPIEIPGNATTKREQSINAYLAQGLAAYLATGDASFTDEQARKLCEQFGCYDAANHSRTVKALKNRATGSKASGWKLTAPGLSAAAELVK